MSREQRSSTTVVHVGATAIGASEPVLIAGPCSVESWEQMMAAHELKTPLTSLRTFAQLLLGAPT